MDMTIHQRKKLWFAIAVSALGYFVDVYDIILFAVIRVPSLKALSLSDEQITSVGLLLINLQLLGMLIGGLVWGVLGDKRGRLSVLFGSILLYSTANLANAFVTNVEQYAVLRFLAGFGLAGEFGAAVTLVSELMSKEKRGYGTTIITTAGVFGGIAGGLVGNLFSWQMAYVLGGCAGFVLLFLRLRVAESTLFMRLKTHEKIEKGNLWLFFKSPKFLVKYIKCLLVGVPFWIAVGLFMSLSPEIGKALEISTPILAGWAILFFNVGLGLGDISSGLLSQFLGSRRKVVTVFLFFSMLFSLGLLSLQEASAQCYYFFCALCGFGVGYWAVFNMIATEQFGTNFRATVAVSLPNFVRGMVVPASLLLSLLKSQVGLLWGLGLIMTVSLVLAWISLISLEETFAKSLEFVEH